MSEANLIEDSSLALDLLRLYDDFSEYEKCCSFFFDAVACLGSSKDNWLDANSVEGLSFFSHWMKQRTKKLKKRLETVRQIARLRESH